MTVTDAVASWWIRNANIRHGHIPDDATKITTAGGSSLPMLAAGGLGAALALLAPWIVGKVQGNGSPPTAAVVAPVEPSAVHDGSLYQYLEDRNLHLPE